MNKKEDKFKILIEKRKKGEIIIQLMFFGTKENFKYLEKKGYFDK